MSDHLFGFCASAPGTKDDTYHALCPVEYETQLGVVHHCSCPNHDEEEGD